ncbi:MAG: AAA family ATPase [Candidatus Thermoplasmatota archaeon]|nr:AAA family ATPase [Candidatus Thermoplasmatota archaeon]
MWESIGKSVFKDQRTLSFDYVPPKLVHRETHMRKLVMLFRPVFEENASQNAMLMGSVGTGKTATAKRFCMDLKEHGEKKQVAIDWTIVNCRQRNSESAVVLQIVNHFQPNFPDRGFSITEMLSILRKDLEKRKIHLVVALDEADVLLKKAGPDIIYKLTRFGEEKVDSRPLVSVILISQKNIFDMIDPASASTFKRTNVVEFGKYTCEELRDIIAQRAELALHEGSVDDDSVDLMAEVSSEWGDARFAIEILEKAGMLADEERQGMINVEHVRGAKAEAYSSITESKLSCLDKHQKLTLLGIARASKGKAYITTKDAESAYSVACEEYDEKPRAHTAFWTLMKDLDTLGVVSAKKSGLGISGKTTVITLLDIPAKVLQQKVSQMLDESI